MAISTRPIASIPSPVVGDPISLPLVPGAAEAFFNGFRDAMHDYPEQFVVLEIVEVAFPDTVLNTGEEGTFRVRLTNNGLLDMTDVTLKIRGLNGTLVKSGGAGDFDFEEEE